MATGNYASSGDPQRTMKLLWGVADAPTRGPKPALTVEDIVRAAVELADAEGLAAVSMRKVAERLGKSAMSLYSYVPGKAELLDLMIDRTLAEQPVTYSRESGWRSAVERYARDAWGYFERAPVGAPGPGCPRSCSARMSSTATRRDSPCSTASDSRPPRSSRRWPRSTGCSAGRRKTVTEARAAEQATGQSDDDWWTERSPLLDIAVRRHLGRALPGRFETRRGTCLRPARSPGRQHAVPRAGCDRRLRLRLGPAPRRHRGDDRLAVADDASDQAPRSALTAAAGSPDVTRVSPTRIAS